MDVKWLLILRWTRGLTRREVWYRRWDILITRTAIWGKLISTAGKSTPLWNLVTLTSYHKISKKKLSRRLFSKWHKYGCISNRFLRTTLNTSLFQKTGPPTFLKLTLIARIRPEPIPDRSALTLPQSKLCKICNSFVSSSQRMFLQTRTDWNLRARILARHLWKTQSGWNRDISSLRSRYRHPIWEAWWAKNAI